MKFALSAAIAAGVLAQIAATSALAAETPTVTYRVVEDTPAEEAPTPTSCEAFPARPTVPAALTTKNATPTIDAVNAYLGAVEAGSTCRIRGSNALNARSNALAAFANYSIKASRAAAGGQPPAEAAPSAPASECEDYPSLSSLPPASDVANRNAWVGSVNTVHQCRLAEVRAVREQAAALSASDDRQAVMADAVALRDAIAAQVEALNAAEAAKSKKGKKPTTAK